jgi:hypothetical protein
VDLVEIDGVELEAAQAGFAFAAEGVAFEAARDLALVVPDN